MRPTQIRGRKMDIYTIEKFLTILKNALEGPYSRNSVYNDLQTRKAMDTYSRMGSGGRTYKLIEKKREYEKSFDDWFYNLRISMTFLDSQPSKNHLIQMCKELQQKVEQLSDLVQSF